MKLAHRPIQDAREAPSIRRILARLTRPPCSGLTDGRRDHDGHDDRTTVLDLYNHLVGDPRDFKPD